MEPKVFISYSWTTQQHQERVKEWADRLLADGVDVILDFYDLKEGHDKNAFMEKMVTDKSVTHVLVVCDKGYADKADARERGVGTESQIISQEVYSKVEQSKFIPLVTEFENENDPFLPVFLKSRIWINFSSPEAVNSNWEKLIRLLYGKPLFEKPNRGKPPIFLSETGVPVGTIHAKYQSLKQAILSAKPGIAMYRQEFLDACIEHADTLRIRERPSADNFGAKVLEDCGKLLPIRDYIIDWVLLEAEAMPSDSFSDALIDLLEQIRELKARPAEVNTWQDVWFEAHALFAYEIFLYTVAALLKARAFGDLNNIFTSHYLLPSTEHHSLGKFNRFDGFYASSDSLNIVLAPTGKRLLSPAATLLKNQANRTDLPFIDLLQADLIALLMSYITPDTRWYPQLMYYSSYSHQYPFFVRATQHKGFQNLAKITGIDDASVLRAKVKEGHRRLNTEGWHKFDYERDFWIAMNMDSLDTIK